jgi:hypothetical protein
MSHIYIQNDGADGNPWDSLSSYFERIVEIQAEGNSIISGGTSPTSTVPNAPTGLAATAISSSQVNLSWTAPTNNGGSTLTGYQIEAKVGTGIWSTLVANAGTGTSYSHTGLTPNTAYTYRISAINSVGPSIPSAEVSATTQPPPSTTQSIQSVTITINSVNMVGNPLPGYYTTIRQGSTLLQSGFTTMTFTGTVGVTYTVAVQDYAGVVFDHWEDGSTNRNRTITTNQDISVKAYYKVVNLTQNKNQKITVSTVNSDGIKISGYYATLWENGIKLASAYSPATFDITSGKTYVVSVSNYNGVKFNHWEDGSTLRQRTFSLSSDTTFTATYTP